MSGIFNPEDDKISEVIESREDKPSDEGSDTGPAAIKVIDINGDVHETTVNVIEETEAEDNAASSPPVPDPVHIARDLDMDLDITDESCFAYSELDESGRRTYREIYAVLSGLLEKVELSSRDPDEIDHSFRAVMVDHPEIFYVKGYSIGKYMSGDTIRKIVFTGTYTMSADEAASAMDEVEGYVARVIENSPKDGSDYDKIKYVYDYLIRNNEYVPGSDNNQNILSVVENGETVCQGYTKAMQLILNRMGIFCTLVNGTACGQSGVPDSEELANAENVEWGGHVWNIVKCDGMYYNIDVTWGDAVIRLADEDGTLSRDIDVNYEFFLVDDATLDESHDPEPVVTMPRCNSMEENYYRHEGLYFTEADSEQFYRAFEAAYSRGDSYMFLKTASPDVYIQVRDHLFNDQNVFGYIGRNNVRYVEFPERNLLMISL